MASALHPICRHTMPHDMPNPAPSNDPAAFSANPAEQAAMRSPRPLGHGAVRAYDWIASHRAHRPGNEAVRELTPPRSFSYTQLDQRADALAAWLHHQGIGRGARVALLAHNGVEYFDLQFACGRSGGIAVLLNWRLTVPELEYILNDSATMLMIHDVEFTETARALQQRCGIAQLLCIDKSKAVGAAGGADARAAAGADASAYEQALAAQAGQAAQHAVLTHDDVVTIMYT